MNQDISRNQSKVTSDIGAAQKETSRWIEQITLHKKLQLYTKAWKKHDSANCFMPKMFNSKFLEWYKMIEKTQY